MVIPGPSERGERGLLFGLLVVCLTWSALAVIGAVVVANYMWRHRIGLEQIGYVLVSLAIAGWVCRWWNVKRRRVDVSEALSDSAPGPGYRRPSPRPEPECPRCPPFARGRL